MEIINSLGNNPLDLAKSKLRILLNNKRRDQSLATIISDFQIVVDVMSTYLKLKKQNVDDLQCLAKKMSSLSTEEEVNNEIATLLNELDSFKL